MHLSPTLAFLTFRWYLGSAGLVGNAHTAKGLRQCNVLVPRRLPTTRRAHLVAISSRGLHSDIRADGSVKAIAVDQPPTSTSSGGKEKVKIGINGNFAAVLLRSRTTNDLFGTQLFALQVSEESVG